MTLHLVLIIAALVCFILGAFGVSAKVNLTDLGLAFFMGSLLL